MSSWLQRIAAVYGTKPDNFLKQLGAIETDPVTFDWAARPEDIAHIAVALGTGRSDLIQRSFAGIPKAGLMFVSSGQAAKTCVPCKAEFVSRGLETVVLHRWKVAVSRLCGRCGGELTPTHRPRSKVIPKIELPHQLSEIREDLFNILRMAMYDQIEAPVVMRVFRAVSTRIYWPPTATGRLPVRALKNGPAIMWRVWNKEKVGSERAIPQTLSVRNFAAWPEAFQIIAVASVRQLAHGLAEEWSDLRKLGLIRVGDATIARRLFRA